jgi:hypothetical protein
VNTNTGVTPLNGDGSTFKKEKEKKNDTKQGNYRAPSLPDASYHD